MQKIQLTVGRRAPVWAAVTLAALSLGGCFNMPTPPSEITGAYTSPVPYESETCAQLSNELNSLARRENELVAAQQQRIKSSNMQAFWLGFGQGDSVAASELANVRGDREAVRTAMGQKQCKGVPGTDQVGAATAPAKQ